MIDNYEGDRLYDALNGRRTADDGDAMARVLGTDADGTVWVSVAGGSERTPLETINSEVEPGDVVSVRIGNAGAAAIGNISNPAASTRHVELVQQTAESALSKVGQARADAETAKNAAAEAAAVAEAVGQHFWAADDGIHVTEIEQDEFVEDPSGANILENANGILLRDGETWLSQFTPGSVAFYDGEGNASANITAVFGKDGAQVGADGAPRVVIDSGGMTGLNTENVPLFDISMDGGRTTTTLNGYVGNGSVSGLPVTLDIPMKEDAATLNGATGNIVLTLAAVLAEMSPGGQSQIIGGTFSFVLDRQFGQTAPTCQGMSVYQFTPYGRTVVFKLDLDKYQQTFAASSDWSYQVSMDGTDRYGQQVALKVEWSYAAATKTVTRRVYAYEAVGGGTISFADLWTGYRYTLSMNAPAFSLGTREETYDEQPGAFSTVAGEYLAAYGRDQVALGKYNEYVPDAALMLGNGTEAERSNAMTVDWDGNMVLSGNLTDGDGRSLADMENYLPLAGGTLTGALSGTEAEFSSIAAEASELGDATAQGLIVGDAAETEPSIQFLTENDSVITRALIQAHDSGTTNGHNLVIRAGGNLVAGGGEYATQRYGLGDITTLENAYIGADGAVYIETNAGTIANRRTWAFATGGGIVGAQMAGIDSDVTPSARTDVNPLSWRDEDGTYIGQIRACQETDGRIGAALVARTGTTDTGGIKQNVLRLYADQAGNCTYSVTSPVNFRKAIGIENSTTSTVADIAAAAANFEITAAQYHTNGIVATAWVTVKTTNALTAGTTYTVATLATGKRPFAGVTNGSLGTPNSVYGNADVTNGGALRVRLSANVAAGASFRVGATYILA